MPIYEFSCENCQHQFELLVKNLNSNNWLCPKCQSPKVKRKFSTFGVKSKSSSGETKTVGSACSSCASTSGCSTCS